MLASLLEVIGRFARQRNGNVAMMMALAAIPLVGITGIAIDYGRSSDMREKTLATLDGALLAAVAGEDEANQIARAQQLFSEAIIPMNADIVSQDFQKIGAELHGDVTVRVKTTFSSVLGFDILKIRVQSAAKQAPSVPGAPCILLLDPTRVQSLLVNSGAKLIAPTCELHSHSNAAPAAIFNTASDITTKRLCLKGSNIIQNGGNHPNLETGCNAAADPYAASIPRPPSTVCTFGQTTYGTPTVHLSPGVYCGWHNFNGSPTVTFDPGVYVIQQGGWNVNGGIWQGSGVTFYFADESKIQFNTGMEQVLSAPTSGPFKDLLFAEAPNLPQSDFIFNNSLGQSFTGLIYLPSRNVIFNATTKLGSERLGMVFNSVIFNVTDMNISPLEGTTADNTRVVLTR